ncbi:MAG: DUF1801 domain-containing protein [Acidimicrobiales bacterium]
MAESQEVVEWLEAYDNPMKEVVVAVREVILQADDRVSECIKWKSPTFTFEGNIASFNPRSKKHASLMFHTGATIPGDHQILDGGGETARYVTFADLDEVEQKRQALIAVIQAWIEAKT